MAKARAIPELRPEGPFVTAAAEVVAIRADELREHSHDVLDLDKIERVHDLRVASRRLRAVLEVFRPCFPKRKYKAAVGELKALADALGERRDRDVAIARLSEFAAAAASSDQRGIESLIVRLRGEQLSANEALAPLVADQRLAALGRQLAELSTLAAPPVAAASANGASAG
jgi:CHAD domain-containing protein